MKLHYHAEKGDTVTVSAFTYLRRGGGSMRVTAPCAGVLITEARYDWETGYSYSGKMPPESRPSDMKPNSPVFFSEHDITRINSTDIPR